MADMLYDSPARDISLMTLDQGDSQVVAAALPTFVTRYVENDMSTRSLTLNRLRKYPPQIHTDPGVL